GMTNLEDALTAVDAGADAVGFVFYEKSPRNISVETAREIVEKLPAGVEKVGVFVDLESEQIREIVLAVGLSAVQLHGRKSMGNAMWEDLRPATECVGASKLIPMVYGDVLKDGFLISDHVRDQIFAILLDSRSDETAGGTGTTFDWAAVRDMVQAVSLTVPVIVAGGLTPANVPEAMRRGRGRKIRRRYGRLCGRCVKRIARRVRDGDGSKNNQSQNPHPSRKERG
ncbi:MAG: phosphoribosylanthranilate isomerase, partial [Candidatus Sulfotelmatobacter sp.]